MQKSVLPGGMAFIERQPKGTNVLREGKRDCQMLLEWTEKCLATHWLKLYGSLGGKAGAVMAMRALLGRNDNSKKLRFIDTTLERLSGDLVAQLSKSGGREHALHVRKLVFAVSYLGKLCRFAEEGNPAAYVEFLDRKIRGPEAKARGAAEMLMKDPDFAYAIGFAEGAAEEKTVSPFPAHALMEEKRPAVETLAGVFHIGLPEGMEDEHATESKTALEECRGMALWKMAQFVLELRQAAAYTLELPKGNGNGNGNGKKTKSKPTIEAIEGSELFAVLARADAWNRKLVPMNPKNAAKFGQAAGDCAKSAQKLADRLHRLSEGKLARKISHLADALSFLESDDIRGAKQFWEETLPSKVKERVDGVEIGLAAKSLLEDKELALAFVKISGAARYAPAVAV